MTDILLIRHGQASLGGDNYDQLSPLGEIQAQWLAEYCLEAGLGGPIDLYTGAMARQHQTAAPLIDRLQIHTQREDAGFNEYDFESVVLAYLSANPSYPLPAQPTSTDLYTLLRAAVQAWSTDELALNQEQETWIGFHHRVANAWHRLVAQVTGTTLLVTSGGVIASILRQLQGLDNSATIDLNLSIQNASITRLVKNSHGYTLAEFNDIPHLTGAERAHAITFA
ncbi:histidine phosphatase family protein [Simiduia aestuariiviva]|uniref:Broad specificity phosphatase PhoE n=1 Tax=Simiduia aestuariiviva TaxID=1510459 RepID=A0A839UIX4_9GAMM|nr:histidine phosphatase family protein [Simiduia aestuariiviva]MBB3167812.1 broad specificity phosphatase PhoE [Simiduia aestuariiviva]